jgi:hypothetical protein
VLALLVLLLAIGLSVVTQLNVGRIAVALAWLWLIGVSAARAPGARPSRWSARCCASSSQAHSRADGSQ